MNNEVRITLKLAEGVDPGTFELAMLAALATNPAISDVVVESDAEQDWDEEELEQLIRLPGGGVGKITETRHLHIEINGLLNVRIPKQELVVLEFLCHVALRDGRAFVRGQAEFHRLLSAYKSMTFDGEQTFKHSTPKIATSLYSRLRKRIPKLDLIGRGGWYGFGTAVRPRGKNVSRVRKPDPLLDPSTPIEDVDWGDE